MDSKPSQDNRVARLHTPLGTDVLVIERFEGVEGLSELFEYRIEAFSEKEIDLDKILGQACWVLIQAHGQERYYHGILTEAQWVGTKQGMESYHLVLRPWLWLCSQMRDCRFFQKKTVTDIIEQVFKELNFADKWFTLKHLKKSYPELEYCVQYNETHLAFVSRLMEHHGIYYFFEHKSDQHELVLADSMSSHEPVPGLASIDFLLHNDRQLRGKQHIFNLVSERRVRTGKVAARDYYELEPNRELKADKKGKAKYDKSSVLEQYAYYKSKHKEEDHVGDHAQVILEAEQARDHRRYTAGNALSLFPGGTTKMQDHPKAAQNKEYLVVSASHRYSAEQYRSGGPGGPSQGYSGHYELLPTDQVFRAPLLTPRPLIHGIQTAKVVGKDGEKNKSGEEIDVDEHGRILVQFHWDRKKKPSCRIRVAQLWAGKGWGGQFIPRIGMEVVVEFLDGDPDRPLVVGCVYNGEYKHPYELPNNKTQSGVKSNSTPNGHGGFNQIMFEDKKGQEEINMQAEKDHKVKVKHAESWEIGETFEAPTGQPARKVEIKKGDDELKISTGSRDTDIALMDKLKAGVMIELKCGASKITMTPVSIELKAPLIVLDGGLVKIN
jgi:type VI secretion system secreted protein VgrG